MITFYLSKAAERESEWRKEKLRLYLNFVEALSGITDCEKSIEGDIKFAKACNDLHALASSQVLISHLCLHYVHSKEALQHSLACGDLRSVARTRLDLALIHGNKGQSDEALNEVSQGYALLKEVGENIDRVHQVAEVIGHSFYEVT